MSILSQEGEILTPKVAGRPVKPIDVELMKQLLSVRMPVSRVADYFNVDPRTLYRNYGDIINQYYVMFDYDIMAKQKELADNGDGKMLIHLGKTILKQTENAPVVVQDDEDEGAKFVVERPKPATDITSSESEELDE